LNDFFEKYPAALEKESKLSKLLKTQFTEQTDNEGLVFISPWSNTSTPEKLESNIDFLIHRMELFINLSKHKSFEGVSHSYSVIEFEKKHLFDALVFKIMEPELREDWSFVNTDDFRCTIKVKNFFKSI
ncbi:MAG: hypothetical protein ACKO9G_06295, partial [Dolichospermum sp.]